jgi:hypothetical protein
MKNFLIKVGNHAIRVEDNTSLNYTKLDIDEVFIKSIEKSILNGLDNGCITLMLRDDNDFSHTDRGKMYWEIHT